MNPGKMATFSGRSNKIMFKPEKLITGILGTHMENMVLQKRKAVKRINWMKYRALFPHIDHMVYLNHAALAPMHHESLRAIEQCYYERTSGNIEFWPDVMEVKGEFKELAGCLINAAPENIAVTDSTSMGLNWLAQGLSWKPGDRIILNNFEFPSNVYPFLNLERSGVKFDFVEHRDGRLLVEDIAAKIRPETRLLSISFVEFLNGYRNDLKRIGELCRENNIIFCVDGIQGLGALHLDVQEMDIDCLVSGGQKWLMWPLGTAFFYLSPGIFDTVCPMAAGWLSVEDSWDFFDYRLKFLPTAERFEPGMFNVAGVVGANASLRMFLEIGSRDIEQRILSTTDYLIERLMEDGYSIYTPLEPEARSGIVTFHHHNAPGLYEHLKAHSVHVSLRNGFIRVSPHFYNTEEDIDCLIDLVLNFDRS
jgi:selenocysteine lyase/cysteine desulfurase